MNTSAEIRRQIEVYEGYWQGIRAVHPDRPMPDVDRAYVAGLRWVLGEREAPAEGRIRAEQVRRGDIIQTGLWEAPVVVSGVEELSSAKGDPSVILFWDTLRGVVAGRVTLFAETKVIRLGNADHDAAQRLLNEHGRAGGF